MMWSWRLMTGVALLGVVTALLQGGDHLLEHPLGLAGTTGPDHRLQCQAGLIQGRFYLPGLEQGAAGPQVQPASCFPQAAPAGPFSQLSKPAGRFLVTPLLKEALGLAHGGWYRSRASTPRERRTAGWSATEHENTSKHARRHRTVASRTDLPVAT